MMQQNTEQLYQFDPIDPPPNKKGKKGLKIWILIIIGIILLGILISSVGCNIITDKDKIKPTGPYIGALYVDGVIASDNRDNWGLPYGYQHKFTLEAIDDMIKDSKNKGLILFVNSPGGGVYESDELYFKLKEYKDATKRPIYAYMASMAASGGYYISTPADKILANRNCWTGSIGVTIGTLFDVSDFLKNYGIKTETITSGKNKAMGSLVDPLTEDQKAIFQSLVDESYEQFVSIVSEERNIDLEATKKLADGRIYTAKQALALGLIDHICSSDDAVKDMMKTYKLKDCELYDIQYEDNSFISQLFSKVHLPNLPKSEAESVLSLIENDVEFPISYMCEMLN